MDTVTFRDMHGYSGITEQDQMLLCARLRIPTIYDPDLNTYVYIYNDGPDRIMEARGFRMTDEGWTR